MSRASGKHPNRGDWIGQLRDDLKRAAGPSDGELLEAGIGDDNPRDIPGGRRHLANPPVEHGPVPVPPPDDPFRRAMLAHGVHPDGQHYDRDPRLNKRQSVDARPELEGETPRQTPVPVYIVENGSGPGIIRAAYPRSVTVPASTNAEPVRVCGRAANRIEIQILNEDTATDIRFATNLSALSSGTGALLPWPSNSYVTVKTQGELYAIGASGSGTPKMSIIEVFEEPFGG